MKVLLIAFQKVKPIFIGASDESTKRANLSDASTSARRPDEKRKFKGVILIGFQRGGLSRKKGAYAPFFIPNFTDIPTSLRGRKGQLLRYSQKKGGFFRPASSVFFLRASLLRNRNSAGREANGSISAPMYPIAAMAVISGTCHVIELADGAHNGARVLLLHRLPSCGHQRLD